jgi:thiol-disulfide isomerase/thioredoxin
MKLFRNKIPLWLLRVAIALALAAVIYFVWSAAQTEENGSLLSEEVASVHVGTAAPDFVADGNQVASKTKFQLSSVKGFPIILHFWATWCGPCVEELPELLTLAKKLRPEGFTVVAVAVDEDWHTVDRFFQRHPNLATMRDHMVLVLDPPGRVAGIFGVSRFPETLLINKSFIIDNKMTGAQLWTSPRMRTYLERLK